MTAVRFSLYKPTYEPSWMDHMDREDRLTRDIDRMPLDALRSWYRRHRLLSINGKTGASLNLSLRECAPTATCAATCYVKDRSSPLRWKRQVERYARNLRYVQLAPTAEIVEKLIRDNGPRDFLRFNGSGDLFPESVAVINMFAEVMPHVAVWVSTRKFALAERLTPRPNLHLGLSLDASTKSHDVARAEAMIRANPCAYLTWLRISSSETIHPDVRIVYDDRKRMAPPATGLACPVDAGEAGWNHGPKGQAGDACSRCRACFR